LPLASDRPPDPFQTGRDFAIRKPSVVFRGFFLAFLEGADDLFCNDTGGTIVLQFVEIGGFERTGVSETHEGTDPLEREETEPVRVDLGDNIRLI